ARALSSIPADEGRRRVSGELRVVPVLGAVEHLRDAVARRAPERDRAREQARPLRIAGEFIERIPEQRAALAAAPARDRPPHAVAPLLVLDERRRHVLQAARRRGAHLAQDRRVLLVRLDVPPVVAECVHDCAVPPLAAATPPRRVYIPSGISGSTR